MYSNCDEVIPHLYIGNYNAARNQELLQSKQITHILTLGDDLPAMFPNKIEYQIIAIQDVPTENILQWFSQTNKFIDKVLQTEDQNILVHCLAGMSRSSSIVIAYLMWKNKQSYQQNFNFLREKHPSVSINYGFSKQLALYESQLSSDQQETQTQVTYKCKQCRKPLFNQDDLMTHTNEPKRFQFKYKQKLQRCSSIFINQQEWIQNSEENSGKINCPYCKLKLGDFSWSGRQCSCGSWVVPAFQIHISSVDVFDSNTVEKTMKISTPKF